MTSTLTAPPADPTAPTADARGTRRRTRTLALPEVRWAAAATACFLLALPLQLTGQSAWLWGPLYALAYVTGGWEPGWEGLKALAGRTLDVDLLMVVAALGAAAIGQVMDGALLIVIFATSGALEALATARTADSVRGLLDLALATASRLAPDGSEQAVPVEELTVGDTILVRPGERVGADGRVLDGASEVDQATITGEPLPVAKEVGDEVFAGTVNGTGALRVRVERDASDSVIARIVRMVEEASETKAPTQLFIEKVEQRYSLGMVAATLAVFVIPLLFGEELTAALLRAMTFMIVASPCAVVLATMPPLLSAIANAGRHGVLVKSAVVMERLGQVDAVALDKTGTLTEGVPRVTDVRPLPGSGVGERELTILAAAAEHASEHPLARAVVAAAHERGLPVPPARDFESTPGVGVTATVNGCRVSVGAPTRLLTATGQGTARDTTTEQPPADATDRVCAVADPIGRAVACAADSAQTPATDPAGRAAAVAADSAQAPAVARPAERTGTSAAGIAQAPALADVTGQAPAPAHATAQAADLAAELEQGGRTAVLVLVDGVPVGVLGLADRLRVGAGVAVAALGALTGRTPVLLTGDNPRAAARLAAEVGIEDVRAGLLPQGKVGAVGELERAGRKVLVVGDGVNDAPALAAAHTGVAMGRAGSDLALETADAVIVRDELATVPAVIALSRRARRLVVQNLVVAGVFIAGLVAWDLAGTLPLPLGVAGHEGSTVLVGLNGLRLLREAAWTRAADLRA
ncbi:heavy metal translocating P-type ATPase [Streptomyces cylindrosporus]|uniref:Heavy metal translocating P-type ATPase n=1 Tax=Streptomyces cylindrosporus TaxID=2927583 RepID=A0ABS9Y013_9ACTN|nr:heavy metal translocating P-type ATPase [Streptomyces cylindrosporus]MCI3270547.1 heavy metal translocating P-type ATPase [Streptomyces cylindrosporus]